MLTPQQIADSSTSSLQAALAQAQTDLPNVILGQNKRALEDIIINIINELKRRGAY
jgi:hypothetical protein